MSSRDPIKITLPDDEDGEPGGWMLLRGRGEKFKAGERQALYAYLDEMKAAGKGELEMNIALVRRMACHLVRDWSLDLPKPAANVVNGQVTGYANLSSMDLLDTDFEDELLKHAGQWLKQVAINFSPSTDPTSPTAPSGG